MSNKILKVNPADNLIVALRDFTAGETIEFDGKEILLLENIPTKHKLAERDFDTGETLVMYGVPVGKTLRPVPAGTRISTENVVHAAAKFAVGQRRTEWDKPDISNFTQRTFNGFVRTDGKVGTRNYWLVIPLVFCENRNIEVIKAAMLEKLGYAAEREFSLDVNQLIRQYQEGADAEALLQSDIIRSGTEIQRNRLFPNVD